MKDNAIQAICGGRVAFRLKLMELGYRPPPRSKERKGKVIKVSRVVKKGVWVTKGGSLETPDYQEIKEKNRGGIR